MLIHNLNNDLREDIGCVYLFSVTGIFSQPQQIKVLAVCVLYHGMEHPGAGVTVKDR